jgi:hypothetical protein
MPYRTHRMWTVALSTAWAICCAPTASTAWAQDGDSESRFPGPFRGGLVRQLQAISDGVLGMAAGESDSEELSLTRMQPPPTSFIPRVAPPAQPVERVPPFSRPTLPSLEGRGVTLQQLPELGPLRDPDISPSASAGLPEPVVASNSRRLEAAPVVHTRRSAQATGQAIGSGSVETSEPLVSSRRTEASAVSADLTRSLAATPSPGELSAMSSSRRRAATAAAAVAGGTAQGGAVATPTVADTRESASVAAGMSVPSATSTAGRPRVAKRPLNLGGEPPATDSDAATPSPVPEVSVAAKPGSSGDGEPSTDSGRAGLPARTGAEAGEPQADSTADVPKAPLPLIPSLAMTESALRSPAVEESEPDSTTAEPVVAQGAEAVPSEPTQVAASQNAAEAAAAIPVESAVGSDRNWLYRDTIPSLTVALEGQGQLLIGQPTRYQLVVTNHTQQTARNLVVRLEVPAGMKFEQPSASLGQLNQDRGEQPGGTALFWQVAELSGETEITADISLLAERPTEFAIELEWALLPLQGEARVLAEECDFRLTMQGAQQTSVGLSQPYQLVLENLGRHPLSDIELSLSVPGQDPLVALVDRLEVGGRRPIDLEITLNEPGRMTIQAVATSRTAETRREVQLEVDVEAAVDLQLAVAHPSAPAPVGRSVVYEVTVTNAGASTVSGVRVLGQFSEGIEPQGATGHRHRVVPGQVVFEPIDQLEPGASVTLRIEAQADDAGIHRFRAEAVCDNTELSVAHEQSTRYISTAGVVSGEFIRR